MRGAACATALAFLLALAASPALAAHDTAKLKAKHKQKEAEHISKEPFGNIPKGPLQIIISIDQQRLHLYSDGTRIADAMIATGMPGHPTPMGVFSVVDKERYHASNIYSGAPMPFMQRITWSGVAMHEGVGLGHPASHGCIRMPHEFAARLFVLKSLGARVIIARPELRPAEFADPHLFVHKDAPPPPPAPIPDPSAAAPSAVEPIKTAQTIDSNNTTDAGASSIPSVATDEARTADADDAVKVKVKLTEPDDGAAKESTAADGVASKTDAAPATETATATAANVDSPPDAPAQDSKPAQPAAANAADVATQEAVPVPSPKPAAITKPMKHDPIAVFISRRTSKVYVRQDFAPLFDSTITIARPEQPFGTHVFTAMQYLDDKSTFRWNVISVPNDQAKPAREAEKKPERGAKGRKHTAAPKPIEPPAPTPKEALDRIEIPQTIIDQISELMVPGSSLVISDQGLGEETGEGTDFIVVTR